MSKTEPKSTIPTNPEEHELVITRVLDAPRALVWKAWTEPERVKRWWRPKTFMSPTVKIDLRVGGEYLNCMRSSEARTFGAKVSIVKSLCRSGSS